MLNIEKELKHLEETKNNPMRLYNPEKMKELKEYCLFLDVNGETYKKYKHIIKNL